MPYAKDADDVDLDADDDDSSSDEVRQSPGGWMRCTRGQHVCVLCHAAG